MRQHSNALLRLWQRMLKEMTDCGSLSIIIPSLNFSISDADAKKKSKVKKIEEDLFGDASDISSDEEGKRKLTIRDSDSDADRRDDDDKPKKKKAKVMVLDFWLKLNDTRWL